MVAAANLRLASVHVPERSWDAGVGRNDVPQSVRAKPRRAHTRADHAAPSPASFSASADERIASSTAWPHPRCRLHSTSTGRGSGSSRAGPLGRRCTGRRARHLRRDARRAAIALRDADSSTEQGNADRHSRTGASHPPAAPLPHEVADVGSRDRTRGPPRLHHGHQRASLLCDPQSPWQRGSNENTNGLLRQYLPHAADLSTYTQAQLDAIALRLNTRPRLTLRYRTPADKLAEIVASMG
jgi:hypothetical protein